mmetsp:Transcript_16870/g.40203  ORF Transcript_16870/g.40203 Transcript_16870/m.40203 type:complete len:311 (-) Transcript_16870:1140-2072(-)
MSEAAPAVTKLVDFDTGHPYFCLIKGQSVKDETSIELTDSNKAWEADLQNDPRGGFTVGWPDIALEAFGSPSERSNQKTFKYRFTETSSGCLQVQWSWGPQNIKCHLVAQPCVGEQKRLGIVRGVMEALSQSYSSLLASNRALAQSLGDLERQSLQAAAGAEQLALDRRRFEEETFSKFSLLLNEKKRRCRELAEENLCLRDRLAGLEALASTPTHGHRRCPSPGSGREAESPGASEATPSRPGSSDVPPASPAAVGGVPERWQRWRGVLEAPTQEMADAEPQSTDSPPTGGESDTMPVRKVRKRPRRAG